MRSVRVTRLSSSQLMVAAAVPPPSPPSPDAARPDLREAMRSPSRWWPLACLPVRRAGRLGRGTAPSPSTRCPARRTGRVAPDSVFFLASVTKPIVATAVMQLVDEGRLDLHAPIGRYVPGYGGGARDRVTAWHVLTHTSGIPDVGLEHLTRGRPSFQAQMLRVMGEMPAFDARQPLCVRVQLVLPARRRDHDADRDALPGRACGGGCWRRLGMIDTSFDPRPHRSRAQPVHGVRVDNFIARELMVRFLASATLPGGGLFGAGRGPAAVRPRVAAAWHQAMPGPGPVPGRDRRDDPGADGGHPGASRGWHDPGSPTTAWAGTGPARRRPGMHGRARSRSVACALPASPRSFTHAGASGTRLWVDPDRGLVFVLLSNQWGVSSVPALEVLAAVYRGWPA